LGNESCFKCHGFGHIVADCTNLNIIALAKWEAIKEEENEEEKNAYLMEQ